MHQGRLHCPYPASTGAGHPMTRRLGRAIMIGLPAASLISALVFRIGFDKDADVEPSSRSHRSEALPVNYPVVDAVPPTLPKRLSVIAVPKPSMSPPRASTNYFVQAFALLDATDRRSLSHGLMLTQVCEQVVHAEKWREAEPALALVETTSADALAARTTLKERCDGFASNDVAAVVAMRTTFQQKLRALQGSYVVLPSQPPPSDIQIREIVQDQDWYSFEFLVTDLVPRMLAGDKVNSSRRTDIGIGLLLAPCSLGKDCSPTGANYLAQCALLGSCEGSVEKNLLVGFSDKEKISIFAYRDEIVTAFRSKNDAYFLGGK